MIYLSNPQLISGIADGIGMIGFAIAGLFAVKGRKVDPVGVFVAVFATAFGGGIVRDLMLDFRPFYWVSSPQWIWLCLAITILKPWLERILAGRFENTIITFADAVGLSFFAVSSCSRALESGQYAIVSVLIGVATGVFGGLLRDVFTGKIPSVVSNKEPYASLAFVGCWLFIFLKEIVGVPEAANITVCCFGIIGFRMAYHFGLLRVVVDYGEQEESPEKPEKTA